MARLRNRIVKAEFWTDGELLRWPRDKRQTYRGLWALAEDSGCLEDDPFTWKLMLWPSPVDADITVEQLESWRDELLTAGKMIRYQAEGKDYLYLTRFHQHEHPRNPQRADLPLPAWVVWEGNEKDARKGQYRELSDVVQALYNGVTTVPVLPSPAQPSPVLKEGTRVRVPPLEKSPKEGETLSILGAVPNYPLDELRDLELLREPRDPRVDAVAEVKKWRDYWEPKWKLKGSHPNYRLSWRNWLENADKITKARNGPLPPSQVTWKPPEVPEPNENEVPMPENVRAMVASIGRAI
jgi:hypothetical protein